MFKLVEILDVFYVRATIKDKTRNCLPIVVTHLSELKVGDEITYPSYLTSSGSYIPSHTVKRSSSNVDDYFGDSTKNLMGVILGGYKSPGSLVLVQEAGGWREFSIDKLKDLSQPPLGFFEDTLYKLIPLS